MQEKKPCNQEILTLQFQEQWHDLRWPHTSGVSLAHSQFNRFPGGAFLRHHGRSQSGSRRLYWVPQLCGSSCAGEGGGWLVVTFHGWRFNACSRNMLTIRHFVGFQVIEIMCGLFPWDFLFVFGIQLLVLINKGLAKDGISAPLRMCPTV